MLKFYAGLLIGTAFGVMKSDEIVIVVNKTIKRLTQS